MARRELYKRVDAPPGPVTGDLVAQVQNNIRDVADRLTLDDDLIQSPAVSMVATGTIPTTATVVVYRGGPSQTLSLPLAAARGANTGYVVHIINTGSVAVTLARHGMDTVNGAAALSLGAGKLAICVADGATTWKVVTS